MRSKNIIFLKYGASSKNKNKIKKTLIKIFDNRLIKSFSNKYIFNFNKSEIKKYKKFNNYTIIGIGGSSLGIKAIYNFLYFKIKKNLFLRII